MTTYTLAIAPMSGGAELGKIMNQQVYQAITGAIQVSTRTGNRWSLSLRWLRDRATFSAVLAALDQLNGMQHRLKVPMSKCGYIRQGVGGGTPLVKGAHTAGQTTLTLKGLPSNTTGILQPGDYLTVGNQLCRVATILSSTGSPQTAGSVTIWPELHKNYSDGATVDYATPFGVFIMMNMGPSNADHAGIGSVSADFMQDVLA